MLLSAQPGLVGRVILPASQGQREALETDERPLSTSTAPGVVVLTTPSVCALLPAAPYNCDLLASPPSSCGVSPVWAMRRCPQGFRISPLGPPSAHYRRRHRHATLPVTTRRHRGSFLADCLGPRPRQRGVTVGCGCATTNELHQRMGGTGEDPARSHYGGSQLRLYGEEYGGSGASRWSPSPSIVCRLGGPADANSIEGHDDGCAQD